MTDTLTQVQITISGKQTPVAAEALADSFAAWLIEGAANRPEWDHATGSWKADLISSGTTEEVTHDVTLACRTNKFRTITSAIVL